MTADERLARIEIRQEALVAAVSGLTDVMEQTRDLVAELMAWLQQPASSDLPDTLKAVVAALQAQEERLNAMQALLVKLPDQVAERVAVA